MRHADLSVRRPSGETYVAELKTGLAGLELIDDVRRVQHYQRSVATRAEVGWVVLLPSDSRRLRSSSQRRLEKLLKRLEAPELEARVKAAWITDWLLSAAIVPITHRPPNTPLQPTSGASHQ